MQSLRKLVGNNIRRYRTAIGWSQLKLSVRSGLGENYLGRVERGEQSITVDRLAKVANALDIAPYRLLMSPDEKEKK